VPDLVCTTQLQTSPEQDTAMNKSMTIASGLVVVAAVALSFGAASNETQAAPFPKVAATDAKSGTKDTSAVSHKTVKIDGLDISYREAVPKDAHTLFLL
jgi:hypothetical protein